MTATYREPESKKELYSLFNRDNCEGAFVWLMRGERRVTLPIEAMELNLHSEMLYLILEDEFQYDGQNFIYIYHPFRKTISKARYIAHHEKHLSVMIPENVKTLDTRLMPRFKFKPADEKFVTIKFESELMKNSSQELKCPLIDLSQNGMAICVTHENREFVRNSQYLELTHLGKIPLPKPIRIENVYMKPFSFKLRGRKVVANRAGFSLNSQLKKFVVAGFADQT